MSDSAWESVDEYFSEQLGVSDAVLSEVLQNNAKAGLPPIDVSPNQGKFLQILAQTLSARRILEVGTLGGYSTIWMARALPANGKVITLEYEPLHARTAAANFKMAGVADKIEVRVGKALETLPVLAAEKGEAFDLAFIDADKASNADYFSWALKMSHPGSVIIIDNVVRGGRVIDEKSTDPSIQGVRRLNELLKKEKRVSATVVQTVGTKGWDGFIIARVLN